ncbi:hypothetical protein KC338_g8784 [Hortaea werneckii]|nr:hypothetical protein KC338_g8784 [Hortaea werneckii]
MAATTTTSSTPVRSQPRDPRRKKEQRSDIWTSLLRQTREAQSRNKSQSLHHRELLVCGGSPDDQHSFVSTLSRPPPPAPPSRARDQQRQQQRGPKGQVKLSNRYAYGYGHVTLFSPPQQGVGVLGGESEEVVGLQVHTLPEPEAAYEDTLRRLMDPKKRSDSQPEADLDAGFEGGDAQGRPDQEKESRPGVAILLSWKEPWKFLNLLRRWLQLLARTLLPSNTPFEDPVEVLKEYKIPLTVVVQHVEAQEGLEREGFKEEAFDYISQCLRTAILPLSAALVYIPSSPPPQQSGAPLSDVQKVLFTSLDLDLAPLSPAPPKGTTTTKREDLAPKHNVVDRMAIVVPSGWDSAGKIRLLSENFSPEATLEAWMIDLNTPEKPPQPQQESSTDTESEPQRTNEQSQANGGAEAPAEQSVYATSDAGDDSELDARPLSPQKQSQSAIASYETTIQDPNAHKVPKPPQVEVTTKANQLFLADMRKHLQDLEAQDAERARRDPSSQPGLNTTAGSVSSGRSLGLPAGEQTGALHELGDVSFNVGGVNYNTVSAEAAIERLRRPAPPSSGAESPTMANSPRTSTPRPPKREEREGSGTPQAPSTGSSSTGKGDLPVDKLEEYFASLAKKAGGGGGSRDVTPSR